MTSPVVFGINSSAARGLNVPGTAALTEPDHLPVPSWVDRTAGKADVWLLVTPVKRRADCVQPHFCATSAQAILKSLGWRFCSMAKLVFGMNQSLDGYVDHLEMRPSPALFGHFV